jgi:hypothetical protein
LGHLKLYRTRGPFLTTILSWKFIDDSGIRGL